MFEEGIFSIMNSVWMIHFANRHRFSILWLYLLISLTDMSDKAIEFLWNYSNSSVSKRYWKEVFWGWWVVGVFGIKITIIIINNADTKALSCKVKAACCGKNTAKFQDAYMNIYIYIKYIQWTKTSSFLWLSQLLLSSEF